MNSAYLSISLYILDFMNSQHSGPQIIPMRFFHEKSFGILLRKLVVKKIHNSDHNMADKDQFTGDGLGSWKEPDSWSLKMKLETSHQQTLVKGSEVTIHLPQCNFYGAIVAYRFTCHMLLKYDN